MFSKGVKMNMKLFSIFLSFVLFQLLILTKTTNGQLQKKRKADNVVAELQVICNSDAIILKLNTNIPFNGMVYAKDAPSSNGCVSEFQSSTNMTFRLPLKSCNTMFTEVDDGIEYFNTVMVQPHMRLMTNQGKGYHIRCKYQTRERTIANTYFNVSASFPMQNGLQTAATPLLATASMPSCTMKIFRSGRDDVAETVKIGDKLIMVIEIDQQDMYGMKITNCVVRDGLNVAEQQLINDIGCPVDETIMPKFEYSNNSTRATVTFPAHKFPHTSSIYYQCNVRLCINNGGCDQPECGVAASSGITTPSSSGSPSAPRRKRFASHELHGVSPDLTPVAEALKAKGGNDMSFDVYSGLYVNDVDVAESGSSDLPNQQVSPPKTKRQQTSSRLNASQDEEEVCLTIGKATVIICVVSIASVAIVLAFLFQIGILGPRKGSDALRPSPILSSPSLSPIADYHLDRPNYTTRKGGIYSKSSQQHCYRH